MDTPVDDFGPAAILPLGLGKIIRNLVIVGVVASVLGGLRWPATGTASEAQPRQRLKNRKIKGERKPRETLGSLLSYSKTGGRVFGPLHSYHPIFKHLISLLNLQGMTRPAGRCEEMSAMAAPASRFRSAARGFGHLDRRPIEHRHELARGHPVLGRDHGYRPCLTPCVLFRIC